MRAQLNKINKLLKRKRVIIISQIATVLIILSVPIFVFVAQQQTQIKQFAAANVPCAGLDPSHSVCITDGSKPSDSSWKQVDSGACSGTCYAAPDACQNKYADQGGGCHASCSALQKANPNGDHAYCDGSGGNPDCCVNGGSSNNSSSSSSSSDNNSSSSSSAGNSSSSSSSNTNACGGNAPCAGQTCGTNNPYCGEPTSGSSCDSSKPEDMNIYVCKNGKFGSQPDYPQHFDPNVKCPNLPNGDTCCYSQKNPNGGPDQCFGGTGDKGFNPPNACKYNQSQPIPIACPNQNSSSSSSSSSSSTGSKTQGASCADPDGGQDTNGTLTRTGSCIAFDQCKIPQDSSYAIYGTKVCSGANNICCIQPYNGASNGSSSSSSSSNNNLQPVASCSNNGRNGACVPISSCKIPSGSDGGTYQGICKDTNLICCIEESTNNAASTVTATANVHAQGIGNGPGENPTPVVTQKTVTIDGYANTTATGLLATKVLGSKSFSVSDKLTYDNATGNFVNKNFKLGNITPGNYQLVMHVDGYLDTQLTQPEGSKVFNLAKGNQVNTATVTIVPGDIAPGAHGDNFIDVIDYNKIITCFNKKSIGSCQIDDLNDDGIIDQKDIDMLLGHFGSLGFSFQVQGFTCEIDPTCNSGQNSLQMCTLICKRESTSP